MKSGVLVDIYNELKKEQIEMPSGQKDYYLHFPEGEPVLSIDKKTKVIEKEDTDENVNKNQPGPNQ